MTLKTGPDVQMALLRTLLLTTLVSSLGVATCSCAAEPGRRGAAGRVLEVGPGKQFATPSAAAKAARNGDTVEIAAGVYKRDAAIWRANDLLIRGVGGRAHLMADGADAEDKGTWVVKGQNTTIDNIEFSGARVHDRNGAGIRQEGAGLTVRNCYFHDNQNGILAGKNPASEIVIENSEFANNGEGDGQTHNMYIGNVKKFTLRYSSSHHADIGHNVKSRALESFILYNRIMDERDGTSSYDIDLPNGGLSYIIGNVIQHGPKADNPTLVSYGAEGLSNPTKNLYVINNTFVNDGSPQARFLFVRQAAGTVLITNNIFAGPGTVLAGPGTLSHNLVSNAPGFADAAQFDYHLTAGSPAIDAAVDAGTGDGFALTPTQQYHHPLGAEPRQTAGGLDIGAFEYDSGMRK